jgi:hypothetical protein
MARKEPVQAVAYLRTSSAANVGADKDSEKRQRAAIEAYAKAAGFAIVDSYYDEAVGGADHVTARPGFAAMMERIASNGVRTIIVETANRFARDLIAQETGYAMLKDQGITLIAADKPDAFLDDTPTATLIRQVLGAVSQFEKAMVVSKLKGVRMRDILGGCDDLQGLRQGAWIGRFITRIREGWHCCKARSDDLLGGGPLEHPLAAQVVGLVEAFEQRLQVTMARDGDAEHLALHAAVEALDHAVGLGRVGLGLAVLHLQFAAGVLEAIGGEARAAVGEHVCDLERESRDRLFQEGDRAVRGLVILDRQMHGARAAVDGHREEALAALAIGGSELRQMFDVEVHEAEIVVLEAAALPLGAVGCGQAPQALGLEDAVDRIAVEMRQEMAHHEGQIIERKAGGAPQRTDNRPLFL